MLRSGLRAATADGRLVGHDSIVLAHIVLGAMCEGVAMIAASSGQPATTRRLIAELRALPVP